MRILIFGAGAVGSMLGGFLARTGHEVSLLGRRWHLDAISRHGLRITGLWGEYRVKTFDLYSSAGEIPAPKRRFDLLILTVKSYDTARAADEFNTLAGPGTTVLSFQNGLGNIESILERVDAGRFLAGRIITGCEVTPAKVEITVSADDLLIGALPGIRTSMAPEAIADLFRLSKIPARAVGDILSHIWLKVIYNCALNGLCTVMEIPYGEILREEGGKESLRRIVEECYQVAHRKGIPLDPPTAGLYYEWLVGTLIPVTASHYPSMLRDIQKGRRTEIDALNGAICRLGRDFGLATPENRRVADLICERQRALEAGRSKAGTENL